MASGLEVGVEHGVVAEERGMLPGIAGICMWTLVVALAGVFQALARGGSARYLVLPLCTLAVIGVFGLLRLRRWGWSIVLAGLLLLSLWCGYMARLPGGAGLWVMALLNLCFFLYLSRPEVRERLRL